MAFLLYVQHSECSYTSSQELLLELFVQQSAEEPLAAALCNRQQPQRLRWSPA
jgi:hypothetical protein